MSVSVFDVQDKISVMLKKLNLFENNISAGDFSSFPNLSSFLSDNALTIADDVRENILAHLASLRQQLLEYFPPITDNNWIRRPFYIDVSNMQIGRAHV